MKTRCENAQEQVWIGEGENGSTPEAQVNQFTVYIPRGETAIGVHWEHSTFVKMAIEKQHSREVLQVICRHGSLQDC